MANVTQPPIDATEKCFLYSFLTDGIINWILLFVGCAGTWLGIIIQYHSNIMQDFLHIFVFFWANFKRTNSVHISKCILHIIPGNCLTCFIVWRDRKTSAMSLLLINLAIVDTLILFIWTSQTAIPAFCNYFSGCLLYDRIKRAVWAYGWPFGTTVQLMGTWSIVSITFSRFVSVCWPSRAPHLNSRYQITMRTLAIHMGCIVFSSFRFAEVYIVYDKNGNMIYRKTVLASSVIYKYLYRIVLYYCITYLMPLSLLVYFTVRLCTNLRAMNKKRQEMTKKAKERSDLTFSLVVVVVVFIICQLPNPIRRLLYVIHGPFRMGCGYPNFYFSSWAVIFVNFNSACNFFIFCLCSPGFRRQLKQMVARRRRVQPLVSSTTVHGGSINTVSAQISGHL